MKHTHTKKLKIALTVLSATFVGAFLADTTDAQTFVQGVQSQDRNPVQGTGNEALFGVAAFKVCQVKTFLFILAYVLAAIGLVVFAIRALFGGFEMGKFLPIIGGVFIIAFADLFIAFISNGQAYYCPSVFEYLGNDMLLSTLNTEGTSWS